MLDLEHAPNPFAVANGDAGIEIDTIPFDEAEQIVREAYCRQLPRLGRVQVLLVCALIHTEGDLADLLEGLQHRAQVVDMLGAAHGAQEDPPRAFGLVDDLGGPGYPLAVGLELEATIVLRVRDLETIGSDAKQRVKRVTV